MKNKIPTAEEFRIKAWNYALENTPNEKSNIWIDKAMIEFAKLHVEAALKEAADKAELKYRINDISCNDKILNKNSILNAYLLTNIK